MPLQIMRKLSFRHRKSPDREEKPMSMRKASSCKGLLQKFSLEKPIVAETAAIPNSLLLRIADSCDFTEQIRLRAVNKALKEHVDAKLEKITHLDVRKTDLLEATTSTWCHQKNTQVALKIDEHKASIVVDSRWTSRDIQAVVGLMSFFRKSIREATIDAPIAELLVVSLSALDLNRWYAFQCYMKAMGVFNEDMHMQCDFNNPGQVYWPNLRNLSIRTTEKQAPHLARVIDYGVQCNWVLDRRNLDRLRIVFTDLDSTSREVKRHLYHFRCWAGSLGFDHRFEQQFGVMI